MTSPRTHIKMKAACLRLGHGHKWIQKRIADGLLEGYKHGRTDVTISLESIVRYEEATQIKPKP
jgi:hypothetical protein